MLKSLVISFRFLESVFNKLDRIDQLILLNPTNLHKIMKHLYLFVNSFKKMLDFELQIKFRVIRNIKSIANNYVLKF